jgi:hypothetical protein
VSTPAPEAAAAPPVTPAAPAAPAQKPADPPKPTAPPDPAAPKSDAFKSEESKRAVLADLAKERDARKALEARFEKLGEAFGVQKSDSGKTDIEQLTERITNHEAEVAKEREARWRAEVANEKGLTPTQAGRLRGATRDELVADADAMIADFGITPGKPGAPGAPKPDPSQGARPGGEPDIDQQIREAESKGDVREAIRLKTHKSMQPAK